MVRNIPGKKLRQQGILTFLILVRSNPCLFFIDTGAGFCHWPKPAWVKPDGSWQPATANFTSLADPSAVGSGLTALTTLMHEAGHAAHFAVREKNYCIRYGSHVRRLPK